MFKRSAIRKFWLQLHLYLGLSLGLVFVVLGLTGSVLVYYINIDEQLNPELILKTSDLNADSNWRSYDEIVHALRSAHPTRTDAWRLEIPKHNGRMITARYYTPEEKSHLSFAPLMVWINPYTAEVVNSRFWGEYAMTWIYDLHRQLLMDKNGKILLCIISVVILISLLTGLYLWWPSKKKLTSALGYKKNTSPQRRNYDIHKLAGVYPFLITLLLVVTGFLLEFPATKKVVNYFSPLYVSAVTESSPVAPEKPLSVDAAVNIAESRFPEAKLSWIETPTGVSGSYRINLAMPGEPGQRFPRTNVWVDQYDGDILAVRDIQNESPGDTFMRYIYPLHSGEALGNVGRVLVCLSGLIPLILYITGILHWRNKVRSRAH